MNSKFYQILILMFICSTYTNEAWAKRVLELVSCTNEKHSTTSKSYSNNNQSDTVDYICFCQKENTNLVFSSSVIYFRNLLNDDQLFSLKFTIFPTFYGNNIFLGFSQDTVFIYRDSTMKNKSEFLRFTFQDTLYHTEIENIFGNSIQLIDTLSIENDSSLFFTYHFSNTTYSSHSPFVFEITWNNKFIINQYKYYDGNFTYDCFINK